DGVRPAPVHRLVAGQGYRAAGRRHFTVRVKKGLRAAEKEVRQGLTRGAAALTVGPVHLIRAPRRVSACGAIPGRARSSAVEHLTFNQVVVGSIPTGLTTGPKRERRGSCRR